VTWAGRVERLGDEKLAKRADTQKVEGKRRQGRTRIVTWKECGMNTEPQLEIGDREHSEKTTREQQKCNEPYHHWSRWPALFRHGVQDVFLRPLFPQPPLLPLPCPVTRPHIQQTALSRS